MRFWFEHSSDVSLREQVVAQVTLGILSGELSAGERLPSIRELARRFNLHANTVSAGYRQLEAEGWVASRRGSGVYVQTTRPISPHPRTSQPEILDHLIANLFSTAARLGISASDLTDRIHGHSTRAVVTRILLVEPDPELRRIVIAELASAISLPVLGCALGECAALLAGAVIVTLPSKLDRVRAEVLALDPAARIHALRIRSVPTSLAEHLPPADARSGILVGIASRWPDFLRFARTMLVAAGFSSDALVIRDASVSNWQHGLDQTAAVICDLVTAQQLPNLHTIVSRVLADGVPDDLRKLFPASYPESGETLHVRTRPHRH